MGGKLDFDAHLKEFSRVLKSGGSLILSILKKTCFIYDDEKVENGFGIIRNDPFQMRNGKMLKIFEDEQGIEATSQPT